MRTGNFALLFQQYLSNGADRPLPWEASGEFRRRASREQLLNPCDELSSALNWSELLKPENGGPGESPGRDEAVRDALAAVAERKRLKAEVQKLKDSKKRRKRS